MPDQNAVDVVGKVHAGFPPGGVWNGRPPNPGEPGWHKLQRRGADPRLAVAEWDAALAQWFISSMLLYGDRIVAAAQVVAEGWEYVGSVSGHPHVGRMACYGTA